MPPILLGDLQLQLDRLLIALLQEIDPADWQRPTVAGSWTVKDVVAHLLDGSVRSLSMLRDGHFSKEKPGSGAYADLVRYLNQLNLGWVKATQRLSPQILLELTEQYAVEYANFLANSAPFDPAPFSVAWAGESESFNWFHIAREYTERWHHQQQIRLALGQDGESPILTPPFYLPYLETSFRALPHHYRNILAENSCIQFSVEGLNANWFLSIAEQQEWRLSKSYDTEADCQVLIPSTIAWRIFSKAISKADAEQKVIINGNQKLGIPIFNMVAVMA